MADSPVAIVTGAAQGLGAGICTTFLKRGYRVCVCDIQDEKGREFVAEKQKEFGENNVLFSYCNVSKESDIDATFQLTLSKFKRVDVLVNNAGVCLEQDPKTLININLMGVVYGSMAALKYMGKLNGGNGGAVINTGSVASFIPLPRAPLYTASKHAILGFTRSYGHPSHFEKYGVMFGAICPSFVDTPLVRSGRANVIDPNFDTPDLEKDVLLSPEYVAGGVMKLLEDRMNGSVLLITLEKGYQYMGLQEEVKDIKIE